MAARKKRGKQEKAAKKEREARSRIRRARSRQTRRSAPDDSFEDVVDAGITGAALHRPVIAPLPSLPEPSPDEEEEEKPALRLAGDRIGGKPVSARVHGAGSSLRATPRKRGIPLPESHAPREILGDAAALFQYVRHDRAEDVRRLLENGADPNLTDDPGNVHREAVSFMCQNEEIGEDSTDGIKFGRTACHLAAALGHTDVVRVLIQGGCDVNLADHAGKVPLMRAARAGFLEPLHLLVQAGADVNVRDLRQSTALLRAADNGHAHVVRLLLDSGAEVDARDCRGRTALLAAAAGVHTETVRALLAAGADPRARDATGADALSTAVDAVEPEDPNAPSPFHVVREERILAVVGLLLNGGARDEPDATGVRPSQRAEERGHLKVAALLRMRAA